MFSLRYCKYIVNLLFLVLWACLATYTQSDTTILQKNFVFICRQKLNFIPNPFMEILQKYANLFWVPWACMVTRTQNDSITLLKTQIFICMQKINFSIHFFLKILHFKESCNLIGRQHFRPKLETQNYARCFGEISITILVFIIDYIREKLT